MNKRWKYFISIGIICFFCILLGHYFFNKELGFSLDLLPKNQQNSKNQTARYNSKENINQTIKESHFQGTALVVSQGQIFYQQSYGYADAQKKQLNEIDGIFPIASLQKIITGAIIFELVKEDKLKLDTTLAHFYPKIKFSESITIQQLLNHNSGIVMPEVEPKRLLVDQDSQIENALDTLSVMQNKEFVYSNGNYTLLAGIISQITEQPYEQAVQKRIIDKLSLTHTYFWDGLPKGKVTPQPYFYQGQDYQADPFHPSEKLFSSLLGAGNLFMSTEDFWIFTQSLGNGQLFEQNEYDQFAGINKEGYQAGMIYFDGLKYSQGSLGGYETIIYGDQMNQNIVILFANQAADEGMAVLSERLYEQLLKH